MPEKINKMPEFYTTLPEKNSFCPNLGGGELPPNAPVFYAYANNINNISNRPTH